MKKIKEGNCPQDPGHDPKYLKIAVTTKEENVATKNKRSNYMIDKSFQINFVAKFIILIVSSAFLSGLFLGIYYYITHDMVITNGREIYVRLVQKQVVIPKKQALPEGQKTVTMRGMKLTAKDGALFLVDGKTMYPTYINGTFRLRDVRRRNRNVLALEVRNDAPGAAYRPFRGRLPRFVIRDGNLGTMVRMQGKDKFIASRAPVSATSDMDSFRNIKPEDIKGVYDRFNLILWPLITSTLIFILITIVFGIFYSHRLAGPIYRINLSLDRIIAGDTDFEVRLRKTDAFQHIGEQLNALLDRLRSGELGGRKPAAPRKTAPTKGTAKKAPARKTAVKKTAVKKTGTKKTAVKKTPAKKAGVKKTVSKKTGRKR